MDDYSKFGIFMIAGTAIACITLPAWLPIYGICWLFKHKEWEYEDNKIKQYLENIKVCETTIKKQKPLVFFSAAQKTKWISENIDNKKEDNK